MKSGQICDQCRAVLESSIDVQTYGALLRLIKHVQRGVDEMTPSLSRKPRVFIGSSSEHRTIAEILHMNLNEAVDCTPWYGGAFILSAGNLENLDRIASEYDYAILVVDPDDVTEKRGATLHTPRDNVIFELGLFMGRIGRNKTFLVYCEDTPPSLPSDLLGVAGAPYRRRVDNNLELALLPVCTRLKAAMGILR
jgi:predicted nucleotide-binding protein